jgi:hypothetical protein
MSLAYASCADGFEGKSSLFEGTGALEDRSIAAEHLNGSVRSREHVDIGDVEPRRLGYSIGAGREKLGPRAYIPRDLGE